MSTAVTYKISLTEGGRTFAPRNWTVILSRFEGDLFSDCSCVSCGLSRVMADHDAEGLARVLGGAEIIIEPCLEKEEVAS